MPTHGSMTKAGKVRSQTPKIQGTPRASPTPKVRSRSTFRKRYILKRKPGQNWMNSSRFGGGKRF